jgi:hypothetical protein
VEICSYWPFADPVGIRPHWSVASPVRFDGCRVERLGITVAPRHEIQMGTAFKLNHEHDPRSHGNGKREKEPAYAGPPWIIRGSGPAEDQKNLI